MAGANDVGSRIPRLLVQREGEHDAFRPPVDIRPGDYEPQGFPSTKLDRKRPDFDFDRHAFAGGQEILPVVAVNLSVR